ncbi:MAG TPA: DUF177 domain-containing protein, partial [Bacteroidales bacterium]|nr:DUF177 domain-containing protein [Bacteroidales bacterium]
MKALKDFMIPFVGLKEGNHDYAFDIDGKFFESFEYSEITQGKAHIDVALERKERMLIFTFDFRGFVTVPCDRCAEDMEYPVKGHERLIVKFGHEFNEESEEIFVIPDTESHIDISTFIYEYIMLSLPIKRVHPEGEEACNPEVIEKL